MKGIIKFHAFLLLALLSFTATAQSISSITVGPTPYNSNTVLTATIQGQLPNPCTSVSSSVSLLGNHVNIYLTFTTQPGSCTQVFTPFTQNVIIGILPAGIYTVHCYNNNTGNEMYGNQCNVPSAPSGCQPPTVGQLYASNITYNSIRINCGPISGAIYYQFLYHQYGSTTWHYSTSSSNNWWNMTGLSGNSNYEYRCRIYCNGGWTGWSPNQYCSTQGQQPGTSCSSSVLLTCGVTYSGSNNYGSNNYSNYSFPNGSQFNNMTGPEAYHHFTLTSTSNVTISLTGLSQNLHLFLLSNCNPNCNTNGGMWYSCNSVNGNEQMTMNNMAPGTYTVLVDGWQGAHCNYNLTIQCSAVITCTAPIASQVSVDNVTPTSAQLHCAASGNYYDWAYRTAGGAWVELPATTQNYCNVTGLQPGVTYYFIVAVHCSNGWSNWSPTWYCTTPPNNNNPGSSCGNPIVITCGNSYNGNNGNGWNNYSNYTYNGQTTAETGPEVVYKLTLTTSTSLNISLSGLSADLDMFLMNGCNGNGSCMAQSGNGGSNNENMTMTNLPAGTYYIVVDGWNGYISNYVLNITCTTGNGGGNTCANDEPCNAQILYPHNSCEWTYGTNTGSTGTNNPAPAGGCNSSGMQDVWYAVQMPSTGKMKVSTGAGTMTNGLLGIYGGSNCAYQTCYGCVDNTNGNQMPEVTITGNAGIWIYLRVWGYNGSYGTFSICVTILSNGGTNLQTNDGIPDFAIDANSASERVADQEEKLDLLPAEPGVYAMRLFPVPAQDELNVAAQLPVDQEAQIRMYDLNGRLVKESTGLQSTDGNLLERIELGTLPTGLYIVKVRAGETELTSKFSKIQ